MFNNKSILIKQRNDFFQSPNVIGDTRFHCGCDAQGLVNPAEVVVHEVNRGGVFMVFQLLAESVGQSCEAAVAHAQREILPLYMAGGYVQPFGLPRNADFASANTNGRRVSSFTGGRFIPIEFDQLRKVDLRAKSAFDGSNVGFVSIAGKLNAFSEAGRKIVDE